MNPDQTNGCEYPSLKQAPVLKGSNKRMFSYLRTEPIGDVKVSGNSNTSSEAAAAEISDGSDHGDRTVKRTRTDSPVAAPKVPAPATAATSGEAPCLLPIITDAELPDPKGKNVEPDKYLLQLIEAMYGISVKPQSGLDLGDDYFPPVTEEQQAAYTLEVLTPARDNNVEALRQLVEERGRDVVNCSNRFGESLLNLACRRGFTELVEFLLSKEVDLNARIKDDFGRTPLHDACWHPKPQLDICSWLIKKDPSLLLVTDKRGSTPFQYARSEDWSTWRQFLFDNRDSLKLLTEPSTLKRFS